MVLPAAQGGCRKEPWVGGGPRHVMHILREGTASGELAQRLPNWRVLVGGDIPQDGAPILAAGQKQRRVLHAPAGGHNSLHAPKNAMGILQRSA